MSAKRKSRQAKTTRSSKTPYVGIVVPTTHWDRAWYLPFQGFRHRLVKCLDDLLNIFKRNPRYTHYVADGQTIVIEDYLEVRPQNEGLLKKYVREGRISIGPWYVLPDEFLVSGESIIRNLQIGHRIGNSFGRTMREGLLPDPFGHISQMPAILAGFGMDSMIFSRGSGPWVEKIGPIFKWFSSDGKTWIHGVKQVGFYGNLAGWGIPPGIDGQTEDPDLELSLKQVNHQLEVFKSHGGIQHKTVLLNQGTDHQLPQPQVPRQIEYVNKAQKQITLRFGDYEDYMRLVRKENRNLDTYRGEMHEGHTSDILSGVYSARIWIKQDNSEVQKLLEEVAEPISTWAWALGENYRDDFLLVAWKHLLKCHPHDDICGCSVDEVHEDNKFNFRAAGQIGRLVSKTALDGILDRIKIADKSRDGVLVYNGSFHSRPAEITATVLVAEDKENPTDLHVEAPGGKPLKTTARITDRVWGQFYSEKKGWYGGVGLKVELRFFDPALPGCGYRYYTVAPGRTDSEAAVRADDRTLENEFFRVTMNDDGSVDVVDKESGISYPGLNYFEDAGDRGDEYDYCPTEKDAPLTSIGKQAKIAGPQITPYSAALAADITLDCPEAVTEGDRQKRSKKTVPLRIHTTVKLLEGVRRVDFVTTVENNSKDHRVRAIFPTPIKTDTVEASQHFDVVKRPLDQTTGTEKYWQPSQYTQHMDDFVSICDAKAGATLASVGLPEYEPRAAEQGTELCLTLLRCVDAIGRGDLATRPAGYAGPPFAAPAAQCQGTYTFNYSFIPHKGDWLSAAAYREARSINSLTSSAERTISSLPKENPPPATLPEEAAFLHAEPKEAVLTSVKRSEDGKDIVVRFFNIGTKPTNASLTFLWPIASAQLARIDETPIKKIKADGRTVRVPAGPKEIITVRVKPKISRR